MSSQLDLIIVVADSDAEWALRTLLEQRTSSLGIRSTRFRILRDPSHDASVFQRSPDLLRLYLHRANYALVMLDKHGSGQEHRRAEEIEQDLETRLRSNGWIDAQGKPRAVAIVLDPELEIWVWRRSPHVAQVIGLDQEQLDVILSKFPTRPDGKPAAPKEALENALRRSRRPFSARIFQELAASVSLNASERAFDKLRLTLQTWFPPEGIQ